MRFKRDHRILLFQILISILFFFFDGSVHPSLGATLSLGSAKADYGQIQVTVPVNLISDTGEQISALQFDVKYDPNSFDYVGANLGISASSAQKDIYTNSTGSGTLRVLLFGVNTNIIQDGTVVQLNFQIKSASKPGLYQLSSENLSSSNPTGDAIPLMGNTGSIEILPPQDNTPPQIMGISVTEITTASAKITWRTDEPSAGMVLYGTSSQYGQSTPMESQFTTDHYVLLTGLSPSTTYHFLVSCKDSSGNSSTSPDMTFTTAQLPDEPPTVHITSPADGQKLSGQVKIQASAGDERGVVRVEFYLDGSLLASDTASPYVVQWDTNSVSDGTHIIRAVAYDTSEQSSSHQITVSVKNQYNKRTWIEITNPRDGETIQGLLFWTAETGGTYRPYKVCFYIDGQRVFRDTRPPWQMLLDTASLANGTHTLRVKAKFRGKLYKYDEVTVTVNNAQFQPAGFLNKGLEDFVLYSKKRIVIHSMKDSCGNVGSNGRIRIKGGGSGILLGDMMALRGIKVEGKITVEGDLISGKELEVEGQINSAGEKIEGALIKRLRIPELPNFSTGGEDVNVGRSRSIDLQPGSYKRVEAERFSQIIFSSGDYYIKRLILNNHSKLVVRNNNGPVNLYISHNLRLRRGAEVVIDGQVSGGVSSPPITVYVSEDRYIKMNEGAIFRGILYAPSAKVILDRDAVLEGAIYADRIRISEGASFRPLAGCPNQGN